MPRPHAADFKDVKPPAVAAAPGPAHGSLAKTLIDPRPPAMDGAPKRLCPICATPNDLELRYCESCGTTLKPDLPKGGGFAPTDPAPAPAPIQPARVVDLAGVSAPLETVRMCNRCRGSSDSSAQFCKYCGSSLTDAQPAPAPRPAEAAPVPAPAPPAPPALASAASTARGRLVVVAKDGGEGPSYPLHDQVDIGRTEGHIAVADDKYLSVRHGRITRRNGQLFLRDLGSVNGIYLRLAQAPQNGSKPTECVVPLRDQDLFLVGQQVIRFEIVRDAEEGFGPAVEHDTLLFGTPTAPRYARLCQRTIEGVTRDVYNLAKRETVLGRESGDIVFTEDPFLSRRHAAVRVLSAGAFALVDLGSSNGTFIQIRAEVPLKNGDQFRIGQQLFRVDLSQDAVSQGSQEQGT